MELLLAGGLPVLLMASSLAGWILRGRIAERHREREAVDALRVILSMMMTFAALVLGLLTSSAKSDFDAEVRGLQAFSVRLIELNQRLLEFGPEAASARASLRRYTAAAVASSWPTEPAPAGDYPRVTDGMRQGRVESAILGSILLRVDEEIAAMAPGTALQRQLLPVLEGDMSAALAERWQLVSQAGSGVSWPLLAVLVLWLAIAFLTYGLSTPSSRLNAVVLALAAVSLSAAVYLIVDFETPLTGLLSLPSAPMRDALQHMDLAGGSAAVAN